MTQSAIGDVKPLGALPVAGRWLVLDEDSFAALTGAGVPLMPQVSGALVCMAGEDFAEVWATNWSRPWEKATDYERVL